MKSAAIVVAVVIAIAVGRADAAASESHHIEFSRDGLCAASIAGQQLPPLDSEEFDVAFQSLVPAKDSSFSLGPAEPPRRCVEQIMTAFKRMGYRGRVGFISELPGGLRQSQ